MLCHKALLRLGSVPTAALLLAGCLSMGRESPGPQEAKTARAVARGSDVPLVPVPPPPLGRQEAGATPPPAARPPHPPPATPIAATPASRAATPVPDRRAALPTARQLYQAAHDS